MARRRPAPAFGALWFLIALIPVSFALAAFQARLDDVMFEHRLYLPAAGVFIAASALAVGAGGKLRSAGARKAAVAVAAIVVLALAAGAYQRNTVWQSGVSLWGDVVKKSPEKVRGYNNLGNAYGNSGDTERGIENLAKALALRPEMQVSKYYYSEINYNLAVLYARNGLTEKAEEHYKESVSLRPTPDAYNNLGAIYFERGQTDEAIEFYRKALDTDARYVNAHFNLGEAYLKRGMTSLAIKHYLEFLKYRPDNAQAHEDLARAYSASGQDDKSDEQARIARELRSRR